MPKRLLLMYITKHSGHHRASLAVEAALKQVDPSVEILNLNGFHYTNPILEKFINRTYGGIIRNTPEVWDYLWDNPRVLRSIQSLRDLINRFNSVKLRQLLWDFEPDVVVCTQAFPCGMVADFKKHHGLKAALVGVVTDFVAHSYWLYDNVDSFVVAHAETRDRLVHNGVLPEKVHDFGIPIDPAFAVAPDGKGMLEKVGLRGREPVVLVMGGGQGLGPLRRLVERLGHMADLPLQLIVVTGTNRRLLRHLERAARKFRNPAAILGHVDNVHELMGIADLVLTKAGGLTTAEALARSLPMLLLRPLPGQEAKNADFLLRQGAAVRAQTVDEAVILLRHLLMHPAKLTQMRLLASRLGKPASSFDIARHVLEL